MSDPGQAPAGGREPVRRTREIEDVTNLVFVHAIANRLTPLLARRGVRPNTVSLAGMACGIAAGVAYHHVESTVWVCAGFALMLAWHVLDGTDGQLARMTNAQSETGKILDGICDYLTFIAVYIALALRLAPGHGITIWAIVAAAGLCHALQSAAYERQRQDYDIYGWGRKADASTRPPDPASSPPPAAAAAARSVRLLHATYRGAQSIAVVSPRDRDGLDRLLRNEPDRAPLLRRRYRETFAGPIRRWSVLSANYRTLGIFVFALCRAPLLYFEFEIVVLSLVLAVLARRQRTRFARFVEVERGSAVVDENASIEPAHSAG